MKRSYKLFVEDILEAMDKIERYTKGLTFGTFVENEMVVDAVIRNLEIIGEASRNIPEDVREKHPIIPWRRMIGLRNIAIHEYFGVDLSIIWEIITRNLPETRPKITAMLKSLGEERSRDERLA
ncbi:MAG: DUF86 domain-containing protein [Chloroflexi bacterium]|nr:DUF86 domain-containing protein [Anaerolineae bacterium]RLC69839.1 MAG: DUF86 domain-containing protein [Chloroflexota bacterium]